MVKQILVLGDSHTKVFYNKKFNLMLPSHVFDIVKVVGATVSGLENPNSKTQALPIFVENIKRSNATTAIVLLGEVDTGFVIWYRAEKYNSPIASMFDKAIENYKNLLIEVSRKFSVICISCPLPTIQDGNTWGEVANERKAVKATQRQRTELAIEFNKRMQEFCKEKGFYYLNFDSESLGDDGLVKASLLNSNSNDHHYNMARYADLIIPGLKAIIEQSAQMEALRLVQAIAQGRDPYTLEPHSRYRPQDNPETVRALCIATAFLAERLGTRQWLSMPVGDMSLTNPSTGRGAMPLEDYLHEIERREILLALEATGYDKTEASRLLGITFQAFRHKLEQHGYNSTDTFQEVHSE
jgi:hypothetical protein